MNTAHGTNDGVENTELKHGQEDEDVVLILRIPGKQSKPADDRRISKHVKVSAVRGIEHWLIREGEEWTPYRIKREYMKFMTPCGQSMEKVMDVGHYDLIVDVHITEPVHTDPNTLEVYHVG